MAGVDTEGTGAGDQGEVELIPHVPRRAISPVLPQSQVLAGLVHADGV